MHVYTYTHTHSHTHTPKTSHKNSVLSPDHCHLSHVLLGCTPVYSCINDSITWMHIAPHVQRVWYCMSDLMHGHLFLLMLHGPGLMLLAVPAYQQPWRPCVSRSSELIGFQSLSFRGWGDGSVSKSVVSVTSQNPCESHPWVPLSVTPALYGRMVRTRDQLAWCTQRKQ